MLEYKPFSKIQSYFSTILAWFFVIVPTINVFSPSKFFAPREAKELSHVMLQPLFPTHCTKDMTTDCAKYISLRFSFSCAPRLSLNNTVLLSLNNTALSEISTISSAAAVGSSSS